MTTHEHYREPEESCRKCYGPGVALVAAERRHQADTGFTPQHDASHSSGELLSAAIAYILSVASDADHGLRWWPWPATQFKPDADPARALAKAGALIAAEIDRIQGAS